MSIACSVRGSKAAGPRAAACRGRSRTQLLLGVSLLAAAGTAWIPTPPTPMRLSPASTLVAPDQANAPGRSSPSADVRLTRA
jgi:hypothetical protein